MMSSICYFDMHVKASNKDSIKKFIKCFNYKEYNPSLTVAITQLTKIGRIKEYDGNYHIWIKGECAWGIYISMTDLDELSYVNRKDRKRLRTINYFCKLHKVNVEIMGDNCEDKVHEHIYVNEVGKTLIYESNEVSQDKDGGFIYQEVLDNGEMIETKIKNNYLFYFLLNQHEQMKKKNILTLFSTHWNYYNYFYNNLIFASKVVTAEDLANLFDINKISKKEFVVALAKGRNTYLLERILKNNISLIDNEEVFRIILENFISMFSNDDILELIPEEYKIKYRNIIEDVYKKYEENMQTSLEDIDLDF